LGFRVSERFRVSKKLRVSKRRSAAEFAEDANIRRFVFLKPPILSLNCRLLRIEQYPLAGDIGRAFKVHSLDQLKVLAGLSAEIDVKKNKALFDNWSKAV
jgi:hypothetical protein